MHPLRSVRSARLVPKARRLLLVSRSPGLSRVFGLDGLARRSGLELVEISVLGAALELVDSVAEELALVLIDQALGTTEAEELMHRCREAGRAAVLLARRNGELGAVELERRALAAGAADRVEIDLVAPEAAAVSLRRVLELHRWAADAERAEARRRALLDASPFGYCELDEHGVLDAANLELARVLGFGAEVLRGRAIQELVPELDWDGALAASVAAATASGREVRLRRADGSLVAARLWLRYAPAHGVAAPVQAWFADRSREASLEEAARRSESLYVELFSAMAEPTLVVDAAGVVLACNGCGEQLLARRAAELVGRPLRAAVAGVLEADGTAVAGPPEIDPLEQVVAARGERYLGLVRHDGAVIWVVARARAVPTPGEEDRGHCLVSLLDDTEKRDLRARIQGSDLDAAVAVGAAHDARNLLTVIRAAAELLHRNGAANPEAIGLATQIEHAARRASELVNRFAALAKTREPRHELFRVDPVLLGIGPLLETVVKGTANLQLDLGAPEAVLVGEPLDLERSVFNLVINARDAMSSGGTIRVATRCTPADASAADAGGWLLLSVEDDGCGMSDEVRERATQRYFTTRESMGGCGLGLDNVARFARALGGKIEIESAATRGTAVRLWLPLATRPSGGPDRHR